MTKNETSISLPFMIMGVAFCVCLIASNLFEMKVFRATSWLTLTGGFLIFPISYILNDCITEVWGFRRARFVIWLGFAMNFFVMALAGLVAILPAETPGSDQAFREVFSFAPQIVAASLLAFLTGSFLNAYIMSRMKRSAKGKGRFIQYFSLRAILSTLIGESADSLVFFPLAFYFFPLLFSGGPVLSGMLLLKVMVTQVLAKTLFEVILLPITIQVVQYVKRHDDCDIYDDNITYNPFSKS